jgi:hypothetical protein
MEAPAAPTLALEIISQRLTAVNLSDSVTKFYSRDSDVNKLHSQRILQNRAI